MTVLEIVQAKINNSSITELDLQLAIDEVEQAIKNYCDINVVPVALNFTWANMAVDLVKYTHESTTDAVVTDDPTVDPTNISALKIGDTQITLGGGGGPRAKILNGHWGNLDLIVMNYKDQLNKFRRMVW